MNEKTSKKRRFPLYIPAEQDAEINEFVDNGFAKSQNDFINKAIEFYTLKCSFLNSVQG